MAIHRLARGIEATERQTDTQLARYEWDFFSSFFLTKPIFGQSVWNTLDTIRTERNETNEENKNNMYPSLSLHRTGGSLRVLWVHCLCWNEATHTQGYLLVQAVVCEWGTYYCNGKRTALMQRVRLLHQDIASHRLRRHRTVVTRFRTTMKCNRIFFSQLFW